MSAESKKDGRAPANEPRAAGKGGTGSRKPRRLLAYIAPAIVSSFFISPASAAPPTGCNPYSCPPRTRP
jgi:hypothetical protein